MKIIKSSILLILVLGSTWMMNGQEAGVLEADTISAVVDAGEGLLDSAPVPDKETWTVTFQKVFWSLVLILIVWIAVRYLSRMIQRVGEKNVRYRLLIKSFIPIIRILLWTLVIYFIIANIIAPPWATLVTLMASAGIAVGFASQDILKNIFGGIMILFDRPFQVGDMVEVGNYYGEITDIGLRTVRLVTPDDSVVTVPNNLIVNSSVSNANNGASNCQVVAEFFLLPGTDLQEARNIAVRAASVSRYIFLKKPVVVIFKTESEMGQTRIKMRLKAYVLDIRYEFKFLSEMTENLVREFQKKGIEFIQN
jgi:small-conductance mechanosensitive channel